MPRRRLFLGLLTFVCFLIISCKKENSNELPPVQPDPNAPSVKMKVNGIMWEGDLFAGASSMNGMLNIFAKGSDKKRITITLFNKAPGSYILDIPATDGVAAFVDSSESNPLAYATNQGRTPGQAGGTLEITKLDEVRKTVSGNFHFRLFREIDNKQVFISEGSFQNLPYNTALPAASSTDTLSVKVDGSLWKPESIIGTTAQSNLAVVGNNLTATRTLGLLMPQGIAVGSYDLDSLNSTYLGQYNPTSSTFLSSYTGKLNILEHNSSARRIRGNFNFKAKDPLGSQSATLTEGYFSVKY